MDRKRLSRVGVGHHLSRCVSQGNGPWQGGHGVDSYPGGGLDEVTPQVRPALAVLS